MSAIKDTLNSYRQTYITSKQNVR